MNEWKKVKLGDLLEEYCERNTNNEYTAVAIGKYGIRKREDIYTKELSKDISKNKIIMKNTLTIGMGSNQIDIGILTNDCKFCVSPAYTTYKIKKCNSKFLEYYMEYLNPKLSDLFMIVSARQGKSVDKEGLLKYEVMLPPIGEQEKIVQIIENTDKIVVEKKELIKEKEKLKKFYMQYIFQNKKNNLNFRNIKLENLLDFQNGLNASAEKYGDGIKYISVMDILNNTYITYDKIRGLVEVDEKIMESYKVTYGDVVFVRSSEILKDAGKSNVYLDKDKNAVFGGFVIRGKKKSDYSPIYLKYALESYDVRKQIMKYAAGNQHVNIGQESLKKVEVKYLDIKYQNIVANVFKTIDKEIENIKDKISEYEILRKGLMQQLLTGKVKVNV